MTIYICDTNFILNYPECINDYDIVITSHVSRELESLERYGNDSIKEKVRKVKRAIDSSSRVKFDVVDYTVRFDSRVDPNYTDNKLIQACLDMNYGLATNDLTLRRKAKMYNIPLLDINNRDSNHDYTGVLDLYLDPNNLNDAQIISDFIEKPTYNRFELKRNQYVVLWDKTKPKYNEKGEIVGYEPINQFRFDGNKIVKLKYKSIKESYDSKIKPINVKQKLAFDLMQNKDITIKALFGGFGTGKDYIMTSHAIQMLEDPSSGIDKIIWVRNNVEVKDTNPIGFLPDGIKEKLLPFALPLADHLGGIDRLEYLINRGDVEIQHLGFIRGRDIKNAIIYVTECENNTKEQIQLLIGRVGEGSQLWLNGDLKQVDDEKFVINSGLNSLKKLAGNRLYGQVTLDKVERSETARLADLLD